MPLWEACACDCLSWRCSYLVWVVCLDSGRVEQRSYTPVVPDGDTPGFVSFLIKVYRSGVNPAFPKGGAVTQWLDGLSLGSKVRMEGPRGVIRCVVACAGHGACCSTQQCMNDACGWGTAGTRSPERCVLDHQTQRPCWKASPTSRWLLAAQASHQCFKSSTPSSAIRLTALCATSCSQTRCECATAGEMLDWHPPDVCGVAWRRVGVVSCGASSRIRISCCTTSCNGCAKLSDSTVGRAAFTCTTPLTSTCTCMMRLCAVQPTRFLPHQGQHIMGAPCAASRWLCDRRHDAGLSTCRKLHFRAVGVRSASDGG